MPAIKIIQDIQKLINLEFPINFEYETNSIIPNHSVNSEYSKFFSMFEILHPVLSFSNVFIIIASQSHQLVEKED